MNEHDAVRGYLEERGARAEMVAGGLDGLLGRWEDIVRTVSHGYNLTLDDYRNDLDVRELIAGVLVAAPASREAVAGRLKVADARFHDATEPTTSVWGGAEAAEGHPDRTAQWWYFRRPRKAGPELARDLSELDRA